MSDNTSALFTITSLQIGYVTKVYQQHTRNNSDKRLYMTVNMIPDGMQVENVPFYSGGVDKKTKYPHGLFLPPRENQVVGVFFIKGHYGNPVGCIPLPFEVYKDDRKLYYNILENINDTGLFHYSGSRITFRENGTIEITKRIDKSNEDYENQSLSFDFKYENGQSKKKIKDENNNFEFYIDKESFYIKDKKNNKILFDSSDSGQTGFKLTDKNNNYIESKSSTLNLNGDTQSAVKGDILVNQLTVLITAIKTFTDGLNPSTLAAQAAILGSACTAALNIINQIKSNKVKLS
jgi:hypothetical protein